jgi:hypothetical protein
MATTTTITHPDGTTISCSTAAAAAPISGKLTRESSSFEPAAAAAPEPRAPRTDLAPAACRSLTALNNPPETQLSLLALSIHCFTYRFAPPAGLVVPDRGLAQ